MWRLLGLERAHPKVPYASALFGDDPQSTFAKTRALRDAGYAAVKLGWGPYGASTVDADTAQVRAARDGLGADIALMVDAGTVFDEDVDAAAARLPALAACGVRWFEEPFVQGALAAYAALARCSPRVALAAGEGSHDEHHARQMVDFAGLGYLQIDAGRIGGITVARQAALHAARAGVRFVNHTFTTTLALSASLQPYADLEEHELCELPVEPSALARELAPPLARDGDGRIVIPDAPGLGVEPNLAAVRRYLVDARIEVGGKELYRTPAV